MTLKLTISQDKTLESLRIANGWTDWVGVRKGGGSCASLPKLVELGLVQQQGEPGCQSWRLVACAMDVEVVAAFHPQTGKLERYFLPHHKSFPEWRVDMISLGLEFCRMTIADVHDIQDQEENSIHCH